MIALEISKHFEICGHAKGRGHPKNAVTRETSAEPSGKSAPLHYVMNYPIEQTRTSWLKPALKAPISAESNHLEFQFQQRFPRTGTTWQPICPNLCPRTCIPARKSRLLRMI